MLHVIFLCSLILFAIMIILQIRRLIWNELTSIHLYLMGQQQILTFFGSPDLYSTFTHGYRLWFRRIERLLHTRIEPFISTINKEFYDMLFWKHGRNIIELFLVFFYHVLFNELFITKIYNILAFMFIFQLAFLLFTPMFSYIL